MMLARQQLIVAVSNLPDAVAIEQGWYVNSDNGEPDCGANYCHDHAQQVARFEALEVKPGVHVWADCAGGQTDSAARCEFGGCGKPLDFCGLTDYGVNTAIGLTEREPLKCHVYGAELELTARSLRDDDPRWTTWEAHARRVIAEHAASADFTGTRRTP